MNFCKTTCKYIIVLCEVIFSLIFIFLCFFYPTYFILLIFLYTLFIFIQYVLNPNEHKDDQSKTCEFVSPNQIIVANDPQLPQPPSTSEQLPQNNLRNLTQNENSRNRPNNSRDAILFVNLSDSNTHTQLTETHSLTVEISESPSRSQPEVLDDLPTYEEALDGYSKLGTTEIGQLISENIDIDPSPPPLYINCCSLPPTYSEALENIESCSK